MSSKTCFIAWGNCLNGDYVYPIRLNYGWAMTSENEITQLWVTVT